MVAKGSKATFPTSHPAEKSSKSEKKLLRAIFPKDSESATTTGATDIAAPEGQFDPDFKVLDEIMDRDAEALRALAR